MMNTTLELKLNGEWNEHTGGSRPVPYDVFVEVELRDGFIGYAAASDFDWNNYPLVDPENDIIRWRTVGYDDSQDFDME
jgi:hypothetical protein